MTGPKVFVASASGTGGVGVLLVIGAGSAEVVARALAGAPPDRPDPGKAVGADRTTGAQAPDEIAHRLRSGDPIFGWIHGPAGALDEAMCRWTPADASRFGTEEVEVDVHGGAISLARGLEALAVHGARAAGADSLPGLLPESRGWDRARRLALRALLEARTRLAAAMLLDQAEGALSRALSGEPDEGGLRELLAGAPTGIALVEPRRVALVGPPNAGKSTLFNRLVGRERTLVHASPGTTRDAVEEEIALQGVPVRLSDTAGVRDTDHPIERMGIEEARRAARTADAVLLVWDAGLGADLAPFEAEVRAAAGAYRPLVRVINKIDRWSAAEAAERERALADLGGAACCALDGRGIDAVESAILRALNLEPGRVRPGRPMIFRIDQKQAVEEALRLRAGDPEGAARALRGCLADGP